MNLFDDAIRLLSEPPGNLVYYLAVMFALESVLAMSVGERLRGKNQARRWLLSSSGLLIGWAAMMIVALLTSQGVIAPASVAPPLERFVNTMAVALIAWAAIPTSKEHEGIAAGLVVGGLVLGLVACAVSAGSWNAALTQDPDISFNGHSLEIIWEASSLAVLSIAALLSVLQRARDRRWALFFVICLVMALGHLIHFMSPTQDSHIAGWVRLSNLIAYPLLAGLVFRQMFDWRNAPVLMLPAPDPIQLNEREVLASTQGFVASLDLKQTLTLAASVGAEVLQADFCFLGLPADSAHRQVELAACHSRQEKDGLVQPGATFYLDAQPLIKRAIRTRRQIVVNEKDSGAKAMQRFLELTGDGPMLVQPLVDDRTVIGVLVAGSPHSEQGWSDKTREMGIAFGQQVTRAIIHARDWQKINKRLEQIDQKAQKQQQDIQETTTTLSQAQQEAQTFAQQLYKAEQQAASHKQRTGELAALLQRETDISETKLADRDAQIEQLQVSRQDLENQVQVWQQQVAELSKQHQTLKNEFAQAQQQTAQSIQTDSGAQGLVISDENGRIVTIQGAVESLLNRPQLEIIGQPLIELFADAHWRRTLKRILSDPQFRRESMAEPKVINIQSKEQTLYAELMPIPSASHKLNPLAVVIYSQSAFDQLVHRGELIASLVQELRTPMTSITGYTDLLLGESAGILGEMQRKFLQRVKANIERMSARLEDLLEISAIDSGKLEIELKTVDLVELVEQAIMNSAGQFHERDIVVKVDVPEDLAPLQADPDAITQVLQNLLSNAYQCSKPDTTVRVSAQMQEMGDKRPGKSSYVLLSITDTGGGIAPEDISRVFTRLYRADYPLIEGLGESGVGLSVAKTLIEAHGGRIWVESEKAGATFSFLLPVEAAT